MKERDPSHDVSIGEFMQDLRSDVFKNQFQSFEEIDESMEEFFSDDGGSKGQPDSGYIPGDQTTEDADSTEDGDDGGDGDDGDEGDGRYDGPNFDGGDEAGYTWDKYGWNGVAPGNAMERADFAARMDTLNRKLLQSYYAPEQPKFLPAQKAEAIAKAENASSAEEYAATVAYDPSGVRQTITDAITASKDRLEKAQKDYSDKPAEHDSAQVRTSDTPENYKTSVMENPKGAQIPDQDQQQDVSAPPTIDLLLPNGERFVGEVSVAVEESLEYETSGDRIITESVLQTEDPDNPGQYIDVYTQDEQASMQEDANTSFQCAEVLAIAAANESGGYLEQDDGGLPDESQPVEDLGTTDDGTTDYYNEEEEI